MGVQARIGSRIDAALTHVYHVFQPRPGTPAYTRTRSELSMQHHRYWSRSAEWERVETRADSGPHSTMKEEDLALFSEVTPSGFSVVVAAICFLSMVFLLYSLWKRESCRGPSSRAFGVSEARFASHPCISQPWVFHSLRPHWLPPPLCVHCHASEPVGHVCPTVSRQDCCAVCCESFAQRRPAVLLQKDGWRACGHFSTCTLCIEQMRQRTWPTLCPICRAMFTDHQPLAQRLVI